MQIKSYFSLLRHWLWFMIVGAVVAGVTAFFINSRQTPIYRASASYLIDNAPTGRDSDYANILTEQRLTLTYLELIKKRPVYLEVAQRLNPDQTDEAALNQVADQLVRSVSVAAPLDTQIIVVSVEHPDPNQAARIANLIGEVFSQQNQDRQSSRFAEAIQTWESQLGPLLANVTDLQAQVRELGTPKTSEDQNKLSALQLALNEAQLRYTDAFQNLQALRVEQARSISNIVPVEPARVPTAPIYPRVVSNTLLAAFVGLALSLTIIFLIEYLDDTVKTPDEVFSRTNLSTLAAITFIKGANPAERLVTYRTPRSPISEAYRVMRTNLSFSTIDNKLESLVVTSSSPGEGKSTTSSNLAVTMAQTGKQVIIIDADLRRPTLHKAFQVSNNQGLTTALLDSHTPINRHLQDTNIPGLRIMASGPLPPNPAELLNSQRMGQVLEALKRSADLIIIDSPPVLTVADAAILAPQVDGCVVVVEVGKTRREALLEAQERLIKTGAHPLGVVMNFSRPGRGGYYQYYYDSRYYTYEYSNKPGPAQKRTGWRGRLAGLVGNRG